MTDNSTTESVLFEIKINSAQYQAEQKLIRDSLGQIVLDVEKTRAAQKALNKERDAGKLTDAQYAQSSVKLREQLRGQLEDQRGLEKGLKLSQQAYNSAAGSADQLKAQLFELRTAYYAMSEAERKSAEGQALEKQALAVNEALKDVELRTGSAGRNVGNYAAAYKQGLVSIVAELVKTAAAQRGVDAASEQGTKLQQQRIGFMTAAQKSAAAAGITDFAQAQAAIKQYSQALTPAVENLVQLQQEQQQVGATTGETSEQYQALGFKIAGAEKQLSDLVAAQQAATDAARSGGAAAQGQAGAVEVAANSLAGLRQKLIALKEERETLDPTTKEARELSEEILRLDTRIQQAAGKIDEFGERVQKNIKKENFDTVSDAIQGLTGTMSAATIVFGDNSDAARAQARALQLMALAQDARNIAIGIGSAREAASIVLLKAKGLFLKEEAALTAAAAVSTETHAAVAGADAVAVEAQAAAGTLNAEAQGAGTAATVASTAATEAQVVVTEGATLAQKALNLAMKLNPIGLVIVAITALVGGLVAYSNASEKTQKRVRDITEALLRFGTPVGLIITAVQKLYEKFELVRKVLDPAIAGFNVLAGAVVKNGQAFGEWLGILDTASEKAAKFSAQQLELAQGTMSQIEAEAKALELAGRRDEDVRAKRRQGLVLDLKTRQENAARQDKVEQEQHAKQLARIDAQLKAHQTLDDKDKELYEKRRERQQQEREAQNVLDAFDNESLEKKRVAREQEGKDIQTNAQRAVQNLQARIERQNAAENAQAKRHIERLDLQLNKVRQGTVDELVLQQQKVQAVADLEAQQARQTLAEKVRLRNAGYAGERAALITQEQQALQQFGLTEQKRNELHADYAQQRAELETKYDLSAARLAVAAIPLIYAKAGADKLTLDADYLRKANALVLAAAVEQTKGQVAQTVEGNNARYDATRTLINQEEQLALAGLDKRKLSELDYQTQVTAITADAVAKRKALDQSLTDKVISDLQAEAQGAELTQQLMLAGRSEARQLEIKASKAYKNELLRAELDSYSTQVLATKAGTQERENVEKQHALNLKNIEAESNGASVQNIAQKYEKISQLASQSLSALSTIQDAASQDQLNRIQKEENASTTSTARKAVLAKQEERISKEQHERQKKYAIAQAIIDGASAQIKILAEVPKGDFGITTAILMAAAALTTVAQIRAISSQKFAVGGVVAGPSHAAGGIQLYHRSGAHLGEMEGEEVILSRGVFRNKRLLAAASALNVAGGGRAFYRDPLEGSAAMLRYSQGGIVRADSLPQVRTGGVVQGAPMDYDLLASKLADTLGDRMTTAFVTGAQALPAQQLSLTELKARQDAQQKTSQQTDI